MLTFSKAEAMMKTARNGRRRLGHNTYLHQAERGDAYVVRFHDTDVVRICRDGSFELNTGGWHTPTTKDRISGYSPARVSSERGTWFVWHKDDPRTAPKTGKCRSCHGAGRVRQEGYRSYYESGLINGRWEHRRIFPPKITMPRWAKCYPCNGTGRQNYGSKAMPVIFFDGIRVDGEGRVLNGDGRDRFRDPAFVERKRLADPAAKADRKRLEAEAEARQARLLAEARPAINPAWLERHMLPVRDGEVTMFKAVRHDLRSRHGARYVPGTTVIAEDYAAVIACGTGLHFSPTPRMALDYDRAATRYLACAVDLDTMIVLDDGSRSIPKVKARSCRVLYETDLAGDPLPVPEPALPGAGGLDPAVFGQPAA